MDKPSNRPARRLRALTARAQIWPGLLGRPTQSDIQRLRAVAAQPLDKQATHTTAAASEPMFNDPPIFPRDINPDDAAESPYNAASATLHIGDTQFPVTSSVIDTESWFVSDKDTSGRTVLGIDGTVIVAGAVAEDGTVTITQLPEQPQRLRGGTPDGCPCTAIYSSCRCPVRP